MKKLLILGAGHSQVPLIHAAGRLGYHTIAASIPGDYPGFSIACETCFADISDPDEILFHARKLDIDGITTCGMDTGICSIGRVCDVLALPGISESAARKASDKAKSKEAFLSAQVNCAKSFLVRTKDDLENALHCLNFPVVLKAVDLMGSRGIYQCASPLEVFHAYEKLLSESHKDYCLIEEFLDGLLFGAEGMITDGVLDFLLPYGTEVYHGCAVPTSLGHWVPFDFPEYQEQIVQTVTAALQALGIRTSPFNCDLILKDGKVYVIEINGRAGASCLSETVSIYYGIPYYEIICRQAMGEPVSHYFNLGSRSPVPNLSHMLVSDQSGILTDMDIHIPQDHRLESLDLIVGCGDPIRKYENGRDRLGSVIVKGSSVADCKEYLQDVINGISLKIQ